MDLPTIDVDLEVPKKIEDEKEGGPLFHCSLCDTEVIHKLAQMFLPGLASACVDNTTGGLFKTPGSVAVDLRREMIDYLTLRTESFVAESVILEGGEASDHPFDIISNLVDDFASSKRNFFSRVSVWLLSEKREDKIDDFIQEIDMNGFWTLDRREIVAETLLKNVDFHNSFHCTMSFSSSQDLADHVFTCNFRPVVCQNQGCNTKFCASHLEKHDSICPFKIISCEQKCSNNSIMRRDMDRHCITVCPMKLVNCPFHAVGCRSAVAQCMIEKHCLDDLRSHVWHLLKGIYKEAFGDDLQRRVNQIALPSNQLSKARDIRSLKFIVKDVEAKLGPFEVSVEQKKNTDTTKDENDNNTNIDSERSTHASDTVISPSSNKAEVNDVSTMQIPENVGKSEEIEHSNIEIKDNEEMIPTSNDKSEENINIEIKGNGETMQTSNGKSGEIEHSNIETKGNEEMIQTSNGKSEDIEHSNIETKNNEEMIQTSNTAKLPSEAEAEVGLVREDITENYNDVVASELKFEGNEENTRKSIEKSAKEISATNEDRVNNNSITNKSIENDNFEDSDNVQSIQNSTMEIAGNVDNNVKNRYTAEDDNLK
ncbi:uncharacterized protein LOC123914883 [Trifolium pratense]|uniref:uncharacterized protein LOC123914883 n=1 Tax=Trifolium pratense TaxID=57577 RepID=UPI001E697525|nr:uncharacterized protein LOC123914883 [Trifolium pratense]